MKTNVTLPQWIDKYIYEDLGANYHRSKSDMAVVDWNKSEILNYLGTYFPRSYVESYCIFENYFEHNIFEIALKKEVSIFDFGCGTGGEIIGLLTILTEKFKNIETIKVTAFDGNQHALRLYEKVLNKFTQQNSVNIISRVIPDKIDDFYDLSLLEKIVSCKFDIIISFKTICEFVTKQQFEKNNPYKYISTVFLSKLNDKGLMLLLDITSRSDVSNEWLPEMMDKGLSTSSCNIIHRNENYNQEFIISHSRCKNDNSKVAWRMICSKISTAEFPQKELTLPNEKHPQIKIVGNIDLSQFETKKQRAVKSSYKNNVYIIDTNIFVNEPNIIAKIDVKYPIILSAKVIDELDSLKCKLNNEEKKAVNLALSYINKAMEKRGNIHMSLSNPKILPDDFDKRSADNMILSVAISQQKQGDNPILLTSDNGLQIKSKGLGINTISLKDFTKKYK